MKKLLLILLCLTLLAGCRPVAVTPPSPPAVVDPDPEPESVKLVRATLTVAGQETELQFHRYGDNLVYDLSGELRFYFDGPVDISSLGIYNSFAYANEEQTVLTTRWPRGVNQIDSLTSLRGSDGHLVTWEGMFFTLVRIPYPSLKATLLAHPEVEIPYWTSIPLAPGEVVRLEFDGDVNQEFVGSELQGAIRSFARNDDGSHYAVEPAFSMTWASERVLLLTIYGEANRSVDLHHPGLDAIAWHFEMVPYQQIVVLDDQGDLLSRAAVPVSVIAAIGMDTGYKEATLLRTSEGDYISALTKYSFELGTESLVQEKGRLHFYGWWERLALVDWMAASRDASSRLNLYGACGLSTDGKILAIYGVGEIQLFDVATGAQLQSVNITERTRGEGDFPDPQWLYWSRDNTKLFYNALVDDFYNGLTGLFVVDMSSGKESVIATGHALLHASPFSDLLFTNVYEDEGHAFYLLDYDGSGLKLNKPGETVVLTKWIDENRVLLSTYTGNRFSLLPPGQKCYMYHIEENRWEFIAEGYGFDYDVSTGRVFLLQER